MQRLAATYFTLQAIGVFAWWAAILIRPSLQPYFFPQGTPSSIIFAFILPDTLLLGLASLAAAWGLRNRARWIPSALWVQAGASAYAGILSIALTASSGGQSATGAILMTIPLVAAPYFAWKLGHTGQVQ